VFEHGHVVGDGRGVAFGSAGGVEHAVGCEVEQPVGVARRAHADLVEPRELAGVASLLLLAVHPHADEVEVRTAVYRSDRERPHPPRGPDDDPQRIRCHTART
jgi:hypothetical protein